MSMRCVKILLIILLTPFICSAQNTPPPFRAEIEKAANDSQKLNLYRNIFSYYRNSNSDSVKFYLEHGLQGFTKTGYTYGRAAMLGMLSGNYSEQGMPQAAQAAADEALKLYTDMNDETGVAKIHNTLGVLDGKNGRYNDAIRHFLLALAYFEHLPDTLNMISSYIKLGTANDYAKNSNKALSYYQKGLALSLTTGQVVNTANLYNNIGNLYAEKHDLDNAIIYFKKAVALTDKPEYAKASIPPLMNIGKVYAEKGDKVNALKYYQKAIGLAKSTGSNEEYGKLQHAISMVDSISHTHKAGSLLEELKLAQQTGNKNLQVDILLDLARIADSNGNYKDAVTYLKQERAIHDSLFNIEKAKEIANLQAEYELNKSNTQLAALKISEEKNLQKKNLIIIIAVILALTLVTLLLFFARTLKLNRELLKRGQELQKANAIKDRLFSIIGHDLRGPIGNIPVLLDIYKNKDTGVEKKSFILDSLEENSIASLETLDKLLNWGKLQIKGNTLNQSIFDATDIMDQKLRLFRVTADNKNIKIINKIPQGTKVYADENHFKFVMRNMLSNAIKFSSNGIVEVNAEKHVDGKHMIFSVKDNGIGIDTGKLPHIFDADNKSTAGTANESGNSIGLMLCKEFVLQNGGDIWVESKNGHGSTFYFTVMEAY